MSNVIFTKTTGQRILRATTATENAQDRKLQAERDRRLPAAQLYPVYGILQADLAKNATGTIRLLEGSTVGSESVPGSGYEEVTVHNVLRRKLWDDSAVIAVWCRVAGTTASWRTIWSNSASRLRGETTGAIAAGASGTINTLSPLDGVFPAASATVHNVLDNFGIASGVVCFAAWNADTDRWEIYAADCAP